ncbi:MAG: phenylalanine--tRNA ligase subunit alpha [Cytophagales bacterium]|nr:phenylalanine--tRNA ligase subunit alpha [Cytophagales bacterium]MDW8384086.1 phenylalanine--tRNA ligase subunit alpha [Flammeovirgaceae bacterium]
MLPEIENVKAEIINYTISNKKELEEFRIKYIGQKGLIKELFGLMKTVAPQQRKELGLQLNALKEMAEAKFKEYQERFENQTNEPILPPYDLTLPVIPDSLGGLHPISITLNRIIRIFRNIGFDISEGPEIEDDWHNFTALNFPHNHPAREMQDTFFIEKNPDILLRTHTSSVQVRVLESKHPPIRTLSPGRVYRNEAISARAHCIFHQIEGLFVDKNVSFADLKQTLLYFAQELFGKHVKIRMRPSFFPFTEPSAEVDVFLGTETEADRKLTKGTGWLEIGGCGMVDPYVFKACGIDAETYTGFAFGMGIERIAMILYQIKDLRLFTENDIRFLKQFIRIS